MRQMWRRSEAGPRNLGLACTDDGLLLGHTSLVERRDGRFVVRTRDEIERLLRCAYNGEVPIDWLMSGFARVATALNGNDQCLARIAAVHLRMPGSGEFGSPRCVGARRPARQICPRRRIRRRKLESRTASAHRQRAQSRLVRADKRLGSRRAKHACRRER
jgi:hypothetical protein